MNSLEPVFTSLRAAHEKLAQENRAAKDRALAAAAAAIDARRLEILAANGRDVERAAAKGMKDALIDRLLLDGARIDSILEGIETVIRQEDPIGVVRSGWTLPNGLFLEQITVPLGVAAIIYESRPNVTADAACLAYKAGCAILLRGSQTALESNRALTAAIKSGLAAGGGVPDAVALCGLDGESDGGHGEVDQILTARGGVDVVLPRGGKELIRRVADNARIPVIETGEGNCHIYVEPSADLEKAVDIIENAKLQKPGACNAVETLLVHRDTLAALMPPLAARLAARTADGKGAPFELRCDGLSKAAVGAPPAGLTIKDAVEADWAAEFLDYILAVKTVGSTVEAIEHINRYGTRHSEAILTSDLRAAEEFHRKVDAACVYVNASTRFTDGGVFGFGAELGISTQKFHSRGPLGLEALTTIKYRITGSGQIRE
ncbi:MAG: glutamate-5-semialdehyde dehydrogenase [Treponema sp.]|jgi:glutamate-5-semialdehyde dehydrogenase|nr:glutamate-5-semialdehyde dehydrogenase [Treponema sp.]